jgi:hypothetical protein
LHATQVISGHQRTLVGPHSVPSISSPMIASTMASSPSGSARTPASNLGEPHAAAHSPMANARVRTCGEETWRRSEHLPATRGWAWREGAYAFEAELHRLEDRLLGQKVAEALDHQHRVGGARDHEIEPRDRHLLARRVDYQPVRRLGAVLSAAAAAPAAAVVGRLLGGLGGHLR